MKVAVVLGIFVVLLLVPPAVSQVADELLVVPGQRIGRVKLEHSIDDVIQIYGTPSQVSVSSVVLMIPWGDDALPATLYDWKGVALTVATRDRVKIEYIFTDPTEPLARGYKTEQGVAKEVPREVVERVFGQPTARTVILVLENRPIMERWIYDRVGLVLSILVGRVYRLGVFRPGEAKNNWKF